MSVAQIVEMIRQGKNAGGLRINHKLLLDRRKVATAINNNTKVVMNQTCNLLDLQVMYYILTGKECGGFITKEALIYELLRKAREELNNGT
jgi:hypothetical protein